MEASMTQLEALKQIAARDGGLLRPAAVVEAARPENSPLHGAFCWDDTEAARLYRLDQAQRLIRRFTIEIESDGDVVDVPAFINVSSDRSVGREENPYRLTESVMKSEDLLAVAEKDALVQLKGIRDRYKNIKRLCDIWMAIDAH
jgi:hypothetical protein